MKPPRRVASATVFTAWILVLSASVLSPQPVAGQSLAVAASSPAGPSSREFLPAVDFEKESASLSPLPRASLTETAPAVKVKTPVESNLVFEGLASYGHYRIFASGSDCKLYVAGVEYDRHSWGRFLGARFDYVAEFLPVVLLKAPVTQDIWGSPTSQEKHIVPGVGFSPFGFRLLWRDHKALKPYLLAKGGMIGFTEKALSQRATYENFSLQSATGVNVRINHRMDLRLGLFSDFHISNGFIVPVNPGLDVMSANVGLSYKLGK